MTFEKLIDNLRDISNTFFDTFLKDDADIIDYYCNNTTGILYRIAFRNRLISHWKFTSHLQYSIVVAINRAIMYENEF